MTSDTASQTLARTQLDYALGYQRTNLSELSGQEFDEFLRSVINKVDLRELRGFVKLQDMLIRDSREVGIRRNPLEYVSVPTGVRLSCFPQTLAFDLRSHVLPFGFLLSKETVYQNHYTGETSVNISHHEDPVWRLVSSDESRLALRRPPAHGMADENLFKIQYHMVKSSVRQEMIVQSVDIWQIQLENFRETFGDKYPQIAICLISDLRRSASVTLDALRTKAEAFSLTVRDLERISDSISS